MRACQIGFLAIGLILPAFWGKARIEVPTNSSIPHQISAFYEDYNFISAYSTTSERKQLVGCMEKAKIPHDLKSQRLKHVLSRMKKLRQKLYINDSEMVLRDGTIGDFFGFHFRPVLFEIGGVQLFQKKALIEVRSYALEPDMILRFIDEYDHYAKANDKSSSLEERIKMANNSAPGLEMHRWSRQNGKWMKSVCDFFFLDDQTH
jgi:hypothetical protein